MKIQKAIEINTPPEKIWPFFVEPEKVLQWCITFKKFEYRGDQRSGKGALLYIEEEAGGMLSKMRFEVTEWRENEKLAIRMVSGGNFKSYEQRFSLEPTPSGSKVSFMEEIILPYGVIGQLIGVIAQGMSNANVDKMFAKLKVLAKT